MGKKYFSLETINSLNIIDYECYCRIYGSFGLKIRWLYFIPNIILFKIAKYV